MTGEFRACLVVLGYNWTPRDDFTDSFSPVVNNNTFRVLIQYSEKMGWVIIQIDVKEAFLHGILFILIFLKRPKGLRLNDDEILRLEKSLYGLVQAERS